MATYKVCEVLWTSWPHGWPLTSLTLLAPPCKTTPSYLQEDTFENSQKMNESLAISSFVIPPSLLVIFRQFSLSFCCEFGVFVVFCRRRCWCWASVGRLRRFKELLPRWRGGEAETGTHVCREGAALAAKYKPPKGSRFHSRFGHCRVAVALISASCRFPIFAE